MHVSDKLITQLPLTMLWTDDQILHARRLRYVGRESIRAMMKQMPIVFVVAEIGSKLKWVPAEQCYQFWKEEVQQHLAENPDKVYNNDFPGNYTYIASEWQGENSPSIILLEKIH